MDPAPLLSDELLSCLRCPESGQALARADAAQLARARDQAGDPGLEGALVREDGARAYPVREGFPILLLDEAIPLGTPAR